MGWCVLVILLGLTMSFGVVVWLRNCYGTWGKNSRMVSRLVRDRHIRNARLALAMKKVNRSYFVNAPDPFVSAALPIGFGATISEPSMAAIGLDVVTEVINPGSTVMDIGSGSGYTSAILALLVGPTGHVVAIDHIPDLVKQAQANISKLDHTLLKRITFLVSDAKFGSAANGPYDAIYAAAAPEQIPPELVEQLKVGGRLLIPVGPATSFHQLIQVDKLEPGKPPQIKNLGTVRFVPLDNPEDQVTCSKRLKIPITTTYVPAPDMSLEQLDQLKKQLTENIYHSRRFVSNSSLFFSLNYRIQREMNDVVLGFLCALGGGLVGGLYTTPMKLSVMQRWKWENQWLLYSFFALIFFPWLFAASTISPDIIDILAHSPGSAIAEVACLGFGWGVGCTTFGIGVAWVGQSLTFGIVLALCSTLGSAIPLLVWNTDQAGSLVGIFDWIGLAVSVGGVAVLALAGDQRDKEQNRGKRQSAAVNSEEVHLLKEDDPKANKPFKVGLLICIISGVLSSCLNVAFACGAPINDITQQYGASSYLANNVVWAVAVTAGSIPTCGYCTYLLITTKTWRLFGVSWKVFLLNLGLTAVMGAMWYFSNIVYGIGANMMGSLGASVGWPIYMVTMVLTANVAGMLTGEWRGSKMKSRLLLAAALVILVVAIALLAIGSTFSESSSSSSYLSSPLDLLSSSNGNNITVVF
ncbi:rhamnose/proton symporter RhaT [Pelomyxa schiedti]|nr:rhamnose/proton symporter RhaT [Pelomyxa schiedti]